MEEQKTEQNENQGAKWKEYLNSVKKSELLNGARQKFRSLNQRTKIIILTVLIAVTAYLLVSYTFLNPYLLFKYRPGRWQAVYLQNGQVYFGRLVQMNGSWITLKNIYYFPSLEKPSQLIRKSELPSQKLIKVGDEVHAPENKMTINRSNVVLIENLKKDSGIVKAIKDNLKN